MSVDRLDRASFLIDKIKSDIYLTGEVDELSTGEKKRLALMIYLSIGGEIILMDEPSSDLDIWSIERLIDLIDFLKKHRRTFIITTNDPYFAVGIADQIVVLDRGEVKEVCSGSSRYELMECYIKSSRIYGLRGFRSIYSIYKEKNIETANTEKILEIIKLHHKYRYRTVLSDIDLKIYRGSVKCIIGANGSGKTTLGKIIAKLVKPQKGIIKIHTDKYPIYIPQEYHLSLWGSSVKNIVEKYSNKGIDSLKYYNIHHLADRHPLTLSGGEKLKVVLARALASESDLQVLDEPTNILDRDGLYALSKHIDHVIGNNGSVTLITHDIESIASLCSDISVLDNGKVVFEGNAIDTLRWIYNDLENKRLSKTYMNTFMKLYGLDTSIKDHDL
jgi:energy-coupling factor transport system ATP-binding protein